MYPMRRMSLLLVVARLQRLVRTLLFRSGLGGLGRVFALMLACCAPSLAWAQTASFCGFQTTLAESRTLNGLAVDTSGNVY